ARGKTDRMKIDPPKILLVDDDLDFRRAVGSILRINGYQVVEEPRPLAVLKTVAEENPDLILLDLYMPGGDGIELLRTMRELKVEVPVVVISGRISLEDLNELRQLGVEEILAKPINKTSLLLKVKSVISGRADL
ncbi:MAG TPA: response regulator, partial [Candidatus Glassbacteria bacterium]|nr:response regulator [Candidatus Glassbacteria bacterium]